MDYFRSIQQSLRIRHEEWFIQALYNETKGLFDWQPLLEEHNAYIEEDMVRYWDIPKTCVAILRKHFPEITIFSSTYLLTIVSTDKYTLHQKGIIRGAIYAAGRRYRRLL